MARSLTTNELEVLTAWLAHDAPGAERLRAQLSRGVRVFSSCDCGCASIGFEHSPDADAESGAQVFSIGATVFDESRQPIGGIALFIKGGELHDMDVHSFFDNFAFPPLDRVEFHGQDASTDAPS